MQEVTQLCLSFPRVYLVTHHAMLLPPNVYAFTEYIPECELCSHSLKAFLIIFPCNAYINFLDFSLTTIGLSVSLFYSTMPKKSQSDSLGCMCICHICFYAESS